MAVLPFNTPFVRSIRKWPSPAPFVSLANVRRTKCINGPPLRFTVRTSSNTDDRVIDVLWKFIAHDFADFRISLTDQVIGRGKSLKIRNGLNVPDEKIVARLKSNFARKEFCKKPPQ
jgi:hypothetical protein